MEVEQATQLFSRNEAAKRLCISISTLKELIRRRRISFVRIGNKSIRFRMSDLSDFIERSKVQATK